jgi:branched-chain amino acid transport system substrate-binding protein
MDEREDSMALSGALFERRAGLKAGLGWMACGLLAASLALSGCSSETPQPSSSFAPAPLAPQSFVPPSRSPGNRVALLAPMTGPNAARGQALAQAAQLALDAPGAPPLDVIDTLGTPDGARAAASRAIAGGAGIIIGPLTAPETSGASGPAVDAGVPVLAFTSDSSVVRPGVWALGLTPAQQVRRLVFALIAQNKTRFAALLPNTDFGRVMGDALRQALPPTATADIRTIDDNNVQSAAETVKDIADYAHRRGPIDAKLRAAINQHDAEGRKQAAELRRAQIPPPPFDALLLASTGNQLDVLTSLLPYYDIGPSDVRVLGPALWASPSARGSGDLAGAWFAAPDPAARGDFDARYTAKYGTPAPGLADFAYDAAAIARVLAANGGISVPSLTRPEGFAGVDGVLGLLPDGHVRRGLAVFEVQRGAGSPQIVDPSPDTLAAPGL